MALLNVVEVFLEILCMFHRLSPFLLGEQFSNLCQPE